MMENVAFLANASNLVMYMAEYMHFTPSKSAINVTNFMGTAFLLALLGGFLSDAFFTTYQIYLISAAIEFLVKMSTHPTLVLLPIMLLFISIFGFLELVKNDKCIVIVLNINKSY